MAFWKRTADGSIQSVEEDKNDSVEFKPEKFKEEITTSFTTEFEKLRTEQDTKMKPILEMAEALRVEREERALAARRADENKAKEDNEISNDDYLLDPADATRRATRQALDPLARTTMALAARMAKQEALAEKEYYYGDTKDKIDAMIAQQPLHMQSRADVINNCYKLVVYDSLKEIQEGKIKARTFGNSFDSRGTGSHSGKEFGESVEVMSEEEKKVAAAFGLSDKDYMNSRKELSYV